MSENTPGYDPNHNPFPATTPAKKPGFFARHKVAVIVGAAALVLGVTVGGASASGAQSGAEPQPTKTVTVEVPAAVERDGCREVAEELMDMLTDTANDVMIPQNEVIQTLVENLQYGVVTSEIESATAKMQSVSSATTSLTGRTQAVSSDYERCVNP